MSWKAGKRIIVWGIVSGLATIAGILNDVPDLIKWAVENVPVGLTGPELLWVAAIALAYATWVIVVWWRSRRPSGAPAWVGDAGSRLNTLTAYLAKRGRKFGKVKAKLSDWDKPTAERFLKEYRIDTAVFILREFGLKERDAYLRELGPANAENPLEAVGQTAAGLFRYTAGFAAREMRTAVKRVVDIIGVEVEEAKRGPQP